MHPIQMRRALRIFWEIAGMVQFGAILKAYAAAPPGEFFSTFLGLVLPFSGAVAMPAACLLVWDVMHFLRVNREPPE